MTSAWRILWRRGGGEGTSSVGSRGWKVEGISWRRGGGGGLLARLVHSMIASCMRSEECSECLDYDLMQAIRGVQRRADALITTVPTRPDWCVRAASGQVRRGGAASRGCPRATPRVLPPGGLVPAHSGHSAQVCGGQQGRLEGKGEEHPQGPLRRGRPPHPTPGRPHPTLDAPALLPRSETLDPKP